MSNKEIVICAAIKTDKGIYPCRRHGQGIKTAIETGAQLIGTSFEAQGFLTSTGQFVSREMAYAIQINAGIKSVAEGGYRGERLFSEDLY